MAKKRIRRGIAKLTAKAKEKARAWKQKLAARFGAVVARRAERVERIVVRLECGCLVWKNRERI